MRRVLPTNAATASTARDVRRVGDRRKRRRRRAARRSRGARRRGESRAPRRRRASRRRARRRRRRRAPRRSAARQRQRARALLGRQVGVARRHRQAVGLAHRRHADDLDAMSRSRDHAPDDRAAAGSPSRRTARRAGATTLNSLQHDGRDAREVAGPALAARGPARARATSTRSGSRRGYIVARARARRRRRCRRAGRLGESPVEIARVAGEILVRPELRRVDEDRQHHAVAVLARLLAAARRGPRAGSPSSARRRSRSPRARAAVGPGGHLGGRADRRQRLGRGACQS